MNKLLLENLDNVLPGLSGLLEPGDRVLVVLGSQTGKTGVVDYAEKDGYYHIDFDQPVYRPAVNEAQFHRAQLFAYEHDWSCI